jgi:hypothetical protein
MLADGGAPGAAAVTVLCDIDFLAGRKGRHAKAGHSVVPTELAILARRAGESVNRALGNPARCHGIPSRYPAYRKHPVSEIALIQAHVRNQGKSQ